MARASALHAEGHRFDSDILHNRRVQVSLVKIKYSGHSVSILSKVILHEKFFLNYR